MGFLRFQRAHNFGELLFANFFWNRKNDFRLLGGFFQGEFLGKRGGNFALFWGLVFWGVQRNGGEFLVGRVICIFKSKLKSKCIQINHLSFKKVGSCPPKKTPLKEASPFKIHPQSGPP